ncbi:MAG TPA: hypothetical protein VLJ13_11920, partial [Brevundimonas sp.]|nr:hypothetical protein [Brevundimonas sp.]
RAKALAAWGVKRDLFKDGSAKEVAEGGDRDAALAAPGEQIERGLTVDIGRIEKTTAPKPKPKREPNPGDLARVEALEAEVSALETKHASALKDIDDRRAALERERAATTKRHEKALEAVKARLETARAKLRP